MAATGELRRYHLFGAGFVDGRASTISTRALRACLRSTACATMSASGGPDSHASGLGAGRRTMALYERAKSLAKSLGLDLPHESAGGGSDGNFTGAMGIPTLDGLGVIGAGIHTR